MPTAHVRGIDLHYETHGSEGPWLVIAHGALGSIAHAETLGLGAARFAAQGFRVLAYDARGHGRSGYTPSPEHYLPAALADDLLGLLDALGLEEVSIYGTSMGASTALMLALAHPKRVRKLVLRAPSPFAIDIEAARARLYPLASLYRWLGASLTPHVGALLSRAAERATTKALLSGQRRQGIVPAIRGFLSEPIEAECLAKIEAPTLIVTHPDDPLHPLRSGEILRARLPNAKVLVGPSRSYWQGNGGLLLQVVASALIDDHIRELEERLLKPEVRASAGELDHLISNDFVEFGSSGRVYDKSAIVSALTADPSLSVPPTVADFRVVALASDVVLATYRLGNSLRSSIWRCERGSWRILFHQGTPTQSDTLVAELAQ